jgi:hypothetical protein
MFSQHPPNLTKIDHIEVEMPAVEAEMHNVDALETARCDAPAGSLKRVIAEA